MPPCGEACSWRCSCAPEPLSSPLSSVRPAFYFPVKPTTFRFQAGLVPFGIDFGNGDADRRYFQVDEQRDHYLLAKRAVNPRRHRVLERNAAERDALAAVLAWVRATLRREHPALFSPPPENYRGIADQIQEDLVVMHRRGDGTNAAILVDVCFPSDWYPDRVAGTDFRFIHGPVPGFADADAQARSMVSAMIDRGPYVRFVWTLKADDFLDHHPEEGRHGSWSDEGAGFLRVERQLTVPFADVDTALFIIRTYIYPFASLRADDRRRIADAVEAMPIEAARYKGLVDAKPIILGLLRR